VRESVSEFKRSASQQADERERTSVKESWRAPASARQCERVLSSARQCDPTRGRASVSE